MTDVTDSAAGATVQGTGGIAKSKSGGIVIDVAFKGRWWSPSDLRLRAELVSAKRRLTELQHGSKASDPYVPLCQALLERAVEDATAGRCYVAWDCLHQFESEFLAALDDTERKARWCTLVAAKGDAQKLGGWRLDAGDGLAKMVPKDTVPCVAVMRELQDHLAVTAQNRQFKQQLVERTLPIIAVFLWGVALALFLVAWFSLGGNGIYMSAEKAKIWIVGLGAGALGGVLSMTFSQFRIDFSAKIPDVRFSVLANLARPALGAVLAIPVIYLIDAKVVTIGKVETEAAVFAFCFLAGFSERWFLNIMSKFEK